MRRLTSGSRNKSNESSDLDERDRSAKSTSSKFSKFKQKIGLKRHKLSNRKRKGQKRTKRRRGSETDGDEDDEDSGDTDTSANTTHTDDHTTAGSDLESNEENEENGSEELSPSRRFEHTDVKQNIFMTFRVIESRNLRDSGNLRVRVGFGGRTKSTRVTTELHPKWQQNLNFAMEDTLEKAALKNVTVRAYSVRRLLSDKLLGQFECPLAMVMHQPGAAMQNKWITLAPPPKNEKRAERDEDIGFIKVSVAVYGAGETPPIFQDDDDSEEMFNAAHFTGYTIRIRLHRMLQVASELRREIEPKGKNGKETLFGIKVIIGNYQQATAPSSLENFTVTFNQELLLPFLWPTVINKIYLQFMMYRGKRQAIIAQVNLPLSDIYAPGEEGYLPRFGPAFLNFYGKERLNKLKRFGAPKMLLDSDLVKFYGRIIMSCECSDWISETPEVATISPTAVLYSSRFERLHHYKFYATMVACNKINPRYASENVSFLLSMGDYGSSDQSFPLPRSSTHPAMPDFDDCRDFCMGWGNHLPLIEFGALWENIHHRMERSNAISRVADMMDRMLVEVVALGGQKIFHGADIIMETIEFASDMLSKIERHHCASRLQTQHDFLHQETREGMISDIREELVGLKSEALLLDNAMEECVRLVTRTSSVLRRLSRDVECSLPDVFIKMLVGNKHIVAYARVPASEIIYSTMGDALSGRFCGKVRALPLTWMDGIVKKRSSTDELPAVIHVKMWLGRNMEASNYLAQLKPADAKCFWEVYHYQSRSTPISNWGTTGFFDFRGRRIDIKEGPIVLEGWLYTGTWAVRNSHERWITSDHGRTVYDDKLYELQERSEDGWKSVAHTDVWGAKITQKKMSSPPKGWRYEGEWTRDLHAPGDKNGWMYSVCGDFRGGELAGDRAERMIHMYRRRVLTRTRRREDSSKVKSNSLMLLQDILQPDECWEYATQGDAAFHDKSMIEDRIRRRRYLAPVEKKGSATKNFNVPRQFEVHEVVSQWQLRAYVFWAKDLLPVTKDFSSRAFVRVSYIHSTKQTAVVDRTANPVFNETLIFDKLLIPGSHHVITDCPPAVFVEIKGERHDDSECFLGRFTVTPDVICSATDRRASLRWVKLNFGAERTRGALLCAFELFLRDVNHKVDLPLVPAKKKGGGIEVPVELRPKFSKYTVQFLCWGLRNLRRHNLLTVRHPFISMLFGDANAITKALADVKENPNFAEPLLTFEEVLLPNELELAPPLILNLHDQRAFRSNPLVGVCLISDYRKFVKQAMIQKDKEKPIRWDDFDAFIEAEELAEGQASKDEESTLGEYRIDWWSKFYTSIGQPKKAPGFEKTGIETLRLFSWSLEDTAEYNEFRDFLDTFLFKKSAKGNFDDHEEKDVTGELKGRLFIKKYEKDKPPVLATPSGVEFLGVTRCKVRLYVVSAQNLTINKTSRACDSYVVAWIGKEKISRKKAYRPDDVSPEFGELFEWDIDLPIDKDLSITVMNRKRIVRDEEIGSTKIDLENRLLTKYRATVGLSRQYTVKGELTWRDQLSPLATLRRYCERMKIPPPEILTRKGTDDKSEEVGMKFLDNEFWLSSLEKKNPEPREGRPAQRIALYLLHKLSLVPEHVEMRPLFDSHGGKQKVGDLLCWVDIFPLCIGPIPPPIDISVRQPEPYQLRLAVFNVFNAVVCKRNFQQPCGDLYVKAFLNGHRKGEKTDVHFRVLDGYASFNYRLILDFDWNPWEKRIYAKEKKRFMRKSRTELMDSLLVLQLWDKNKFSKDTLLGELTLDLQGFQEGMMDPEEIEAVYYSQLRYKNLCGRCIVHSWKHRPWICCNPNRRSEVKKKNQVPLPKAPLYKPPAENYPFFHPFDGEPLHGYFPMLRKGRELPTEQRLDYVARKKKDDDLDEKAEKDYVTGIVELELQLLSKDEALSDPVGRKRKKPNQSPHLGKPERSAWDSHWLLSRFRPALRHFWNKYGKVILVWLVIIIFVLILLAAIFYNLPDIMTKLFDSTAEVIAGDDDGDNNSTET